MRASSSRSYVLRYCQSTTQSQTKDTNAIDETKQPTRNPSSAAGTVTKYAGHRALISLTALEPDQLSHHTGWRP